jgi:hypothetical protein
MKNLILILLFLPITLSAQHWYAMDIDIKKGRQGDVIELMDDFYKDGTPEGMQVYLMYNDIGNHKELSNHQIVFKADLQTLSDGLGGKFNKGAESSLFWKRLWEMAEFVQDYTGENRAQYGDVNDTTKNLQFVWAVKANNRGQWVEAWAKMINKHNPKNTYHIISNAILNRGFGGANLYGLTSASSYKEMIDAQNMRYNSKEWSEFIENNGGGEVLLHWSRSMVKTWN